MTPLGREEVAWARQAPPGSGKPLQPLSHRGRHLVRGICNRAASAARPGFPPPRSKTDRRDDVGPFRECSLLSAPRGPHGPSRPRGVGVLRLCARLAPAPYVPSVLHVYATGTFCVAPARRSGLSV